MPGEYLVDTSVVVDLFRGSADLVQRLEVEPRIVLSSVVLGELYFGAERSSRRERSLEQLRGFIARCRFVGCDEVTALLYGRIKQRLYERGRPIPENDLWIAATAMQHGLVVVSRDRHFSEIHDLTIERW